MICYIYWMSFFLAAYVVWDEIWWVRILLLIIAGVFLFLAQREYKIKQREIEVMTMAILELAKCCEKESGMRYLQSKYLRKLWKRVIELEKQKEGDEDAD